jgi:hypothetical protein
MDPHNVEFVDYCDENYVVLLGTATYFNLFSCFKACAAATAAGVLLTMLS